MTETAMHYAEQCAKDKLKLVNNLISLREQAISSGKYDKYSYRKKIDIEKLFDAAARHYIKYIFNIEKDEESGFTHLAHITANLIMIHVQLKILKNEKNKTKS
jgi:hypothetical protein